MIKEAGKIFLTDEYSLFEHDELNRDGGKEKRWKHTKKHISDIGFSISRPIVVFSEKVNGKFKIKEGHHRLSIAMELGIPFYFIICDDYLPTYIDAKTTVNWSNEDYLSSFVKANRPIYKKLQQFIFETGVSIGQAVSIFMGELSSSNNYIDKFRDGSLEIRASDDVINSHKKLIIIAKNKFINLKGLSSPMAAISMTIYTSGVDVQRLKNKFEQYPIGKICAHPKLKDEWLSLLEKIYNYKRNDNEIVFALKQISIEQARIRQKKFGE